MGCGHGWGMPHVGHIVVSEPMLLLLPQERLRTAQCPLVALGKCGSPPLYPSPLPCPGGYVCVFWGVVTGIIAFLSLDPLPSSAQTRAVGTAGAASQVLPSPEVASMCQGSRRGRNEGLRVPLTGDTPHGAFFCCPDLFSFWHSDRLLGPLWSPLTS